MPEKVMTSDSRLRSNRYTISIPDLFLRRLAVENSSFPTMKCSYLEKSSVLNSAVIYGSPFILLW